MKTRKLSADCGHRLTQTTPHLFAWLIFTSKLSDGDKATVITQHMAMERPLAPHFKNAYGLALQCGREIDATAKTIAAETGMAHRLLGDGERATGVYRPSVQLASGHFAMLDDRMGFSLVPWKPAIEQRLGQTMIAVVRGSSVSWELGRQRGPSVG